MTTKMKRRNYLNASLLAATRASNTSLSLPVILPLIQISDLLSAPIMIAGNLSNEPTP